MDGAGHAVLLLDVQLGESVLYALTTTIAKTTLVDGSVANISLRRGIHNVSHLETLHGLILRPHAKRSSALPYRRNDRSGCSERDSHDLFPSWNDRDFFKTVNRHSQQHHDHHLTHAQNEYLPTLERHPLLNEHDVENSIGKGWCMNRDRITSHWCPFLSIHPSSIIHVLAHIVAFSSCQEGSV